MGDYLKERGSGDLVNFQGSPYPSSRIVHSNEQEIKERWQRTCTDEQVGLDKKIDVKMRV